MAGYAVPRREANGTSPGHSCVCMLVCLFACLRVWLFHVSSIFHLFDVSGSERWRESNGIGQRMRRVKLYVP